MIHYVGDIHQPLHSVAKVDKAYPEGDEGGNDEKIDTSIEGVDNLHSVWDSVIYEFTGYADIPLNDSDWDWFTQKAASLAETYPVPASKLNAGDFSEWASESLTLAETIVYPGFVEHEVPSDEY